MRAAISCLLVRRCRSCQRQSFGSSAGRVAGCGAGPARGRRLRLVDETGSPTSWRRPQRHGDDGLAARVDVRLRGLARAQSASPRHQALRRITITGPVILRSSSTVKLVGSEIAAGSGGTKTCSTAARRSRSRAAATGASVTSPATSTSRNESSRWQAAGRQQRRQACDGGQDRRRAPRRRDHLEPVVAPHAVRRLRLLCGRNIT